MLPQRSKTSIALDWCRYRSGALLKNKAGGTKDGTLAPEKIQVMAPYNVQVARPQARLNRSSKAETVDKCQSQAPARIHSITAKNENDAPREVRFLLEPNLLNVAISRAQCVSIVVGSPGLASGVANTVAEAEKINRLCQFRIKVMA